MKRRRLPRVLLNAATVALLVLCAATVAVWARSSMGVDDSIYVHARANRYRFDSGNGAVTVARFPAAPGDRGRRTITFYFGDDNYTLRHYGENVEEDGRMGEMWAGEPGSYGLLGLGVLLRPNWGGATLVLRLPYWFVLGALGSPLLAGHLLKRRRARRSMGLCAVCGYDLRATPDRCPECGTVPAGPSA